MAKYAKNDFNRLSGSTRLLKTLDLNLLKSLLHITGQTLNLTTTYQAQTFQREARLDHSHPYKYICNFAYNLHQLCSKSTG